MIKGGCKSCGKITYFNYTSLDGDKRLGCSNWECEDVDVNGVACWAHEEIKDLVWERLGFCACRDPDSVFIFLNKYLDLKTERELAVKNEEMSLEDRTAISKLYGQKSYDLINENKEEIMWFIEYFLDEKRITAHGGNVSGSWIEDKKFKECLEIVCQEI